MTTPNISRIAVTLAATPAGTERRMEFPTRPSWWDRNFESTRRQAAIDTFEMADLSIAISELQMHVQLSGPTPDDAAALIRRQRAVRWLAELGRAKLPSLLDNETAYWVLHWQQQAADFLADAAWSKVMEFPPSVVESGLRDALRSNVERQILAEDEIER